MTRVEHTSEAASRVPTSNQVDAASQAEPGAGRTAAPLVSTPERDRRNGRFIPGNRAAARRPEIGRDAARKAHRRNRDLAGMITEQVTQAQVKAHVRRLSKIIQEGDDREALAAFVLIYGKASNPGRPKPAPAPPTSTVIELPVPPEIRYNG